MYSKTWPIALWCLHVSKAALLLVLLLGAATAEPGQSGGGFFGFKKTQANELGAARSDTTGSVEAVEAALIRDNPGKRKAQAPEEKTFIKTTFKAQRSQSTHINVTVEHRDFCDFFMSTESRPHILHARNFQQIDHNTFRCEMEPIQFFSASIVPILDIKVDVDAKKPSALIHAISGKVKQSDRPVSENGGFSHKGEINATSFEMNTTNFVTWTQIDEKTIKVTSDLSMEISMQKPAWLLVPNSMMNRVGSMVLQQVLKKTLPEFLDRIGKGYYEWCGASQTA